MSDQYGKGWKRPGMNSSDYGKSSDHNHDRRNYSGVGPKDYKRSDEHIKDEVCEILFWSNDVDASDIDVSDEEGEIYLKGTVDSRHAKRLAERLVENLSGVRDVHNQLAITKDLDVQGDKIIARGDNGLFSQEILQK